MVVTKLLAVIWLLAVTRAQVSTALSLLHHPEKTTRRKLLLTILPTPLSLIGSTPVVQALGEGEQRMTLQEKPTAPLRALVPAVQQRLLLEAAAVVTASSSSQARIEKLKTILLPPEEERISSHRRRKQEETIRTLERYDPALVLSGSTTRAAMDLYTANLNYNDILVSNPIDALSISDPVWKKEYIRANNGLPNLQQVVGADLDLRNLYRNRVQEALDDASAELYNTVNVDVEELHRLLKEAAQLFDLWLDRVREEEVRSAIQAVDGTT